MVSSVAGVVGADCAVTRAGVRVHSARHKGFREREFIQCGGALISLRPRKLVIQNPVIRGQGSIRAGVGLACGMRVTCRRTVAGAAQLNCFPFNTRSVTRFDTQSFY